MNTSLVKKEILLEFVQKFFKQRHTCLSRDCLVIFGYFYSLNKLKYEKVFLSTTLFYHDYNYEIEFDKLFKNQQLDFNLLYKINELIDELIRNQLLEVSLYPPETKNKGINYIATLGKYNQYFEIENEENIYQSSLEKTTYTKNYCERKRLILLNNCKLLEKIERKNGFREYWISRSRWRDLEGMSKLEIQFFHSYIVLIEFFTYNYFYVAVVQKNIYADNPNNEKYLPREPIGHIDTRIGHDNTKFSEQLAEKIYLYYGFEGSRILTFNQGKTICKPENLIELHEQAHLELKDNLLSD